MTDRLAAIVAEAWATIPPEPTTGEVLRALTVAARQAHELGAAGRIAEGERAYDELLADMRACGHV